MSLVRGAIKVVDFFSDIAFAKLPGTLVNKSNALSAFMDSLGIQTSLAYTEPEKKSLYVVW